ncbi:hypothetical protein ACQKP8_23235 [Photobacterium alginatilyticum]|uniref:hypothetical protein n=1 Tax=Photobacterium alginatilyticum TaxID=1775171 RepID=UPI004067A337
MLDAVPAKVMLVVPEFETVTDEKVPLPSLDAITPELTANVSVTVSPSASATDTDDKSILVATSSETLALTGKPESVGALLLSP